MTVGELAENCGFELEAGKDALDKEVSGGYCGDLLSWVMGRAEAGCAWVTVIGNVNAVAVAVLANVACIILAQGAELDGEAKKRAEENDIPVFKSEKSSFELSIQIAKAMNL